MFLSIWYIISFFFFFFSTERDFNPPPPPPPPPPQKKKKKKKERKSCRKGEIYLISTPMIYNCSNAGVSKLTKGRRSDRGRTVSIRLGGQHLKRIKRTCNRLEPLDWYERDVSFGTCGSLSCIPATRMIALDNKNKKISYIGSLKKKIKGCRSFFFSYNFFYTKLDILRFHSL